MYLIKFHSEVLLLPNASGQVIQLADNISETGSREPLPQFNFETMVVCTHKEGVH